MSWSLWPTSWLSHLGQIILFAFCFPLERVQNFPCLYPVLLKHVPPGLWLLSKVSCTSLGMKIYPTTITDTWPSWGPWLSTATHHETPCVHVCISSSQMPQRGEMLPPLEQPLPILVVYFDFPPKNNSDWQNYFQVLLIGGTHWEGEAVMSPCWETILEVRFSFHLLQ